MKINYQKKLEEIIEKEEKLNRIPKLLLHSCCAPCSTYVLEYLTKHFDITVMYYNPNIYPEEEYIKRENEQKRFIDLITPINKIDFLAADYNPKEFFTAVKGYEKEPEGGARCGICFELRIDKAAEKAKELGYDYFTTTLSISPHKNVEIINQIGESLEKKYNVGYLYADFKKKNGYKRSIELCKKFDVYRQNYCGCVFSLKESQERERQKMLMDLVDKVF